MRTRITAFSRPLVISGVLPSVTLKRLPLAGRARYAIVSGLMLVAALLQPLRAFAHYEGGSWSWFGGHNLLVINYDNNCSPFIGVVDDAINGWNATWTPVWFNKVGSACNPMDNQLDVYTGDDRSPDIMAWTSNYERDCFIVCWWDADFDDTIEHSIIRLNTNVGGVYDPSGPLTCTGLPFGLTYPCRQIGFSLLSRADQQLVVTHELGHTLGLDHAGYYAGESTGYYSVMDYCCPGYSTPRDHDVSDINALYPGW